MADEVTIFQITRGIMRASILFVAVLASPAMAGEAPTNDFAAHVMRGDSARTAGDQLAAVDAYMQALAIRADSVVEGRLGLVLLGLREFDLAALHLHHAIEKPSANTSNAEQTGFFHAYQAAIREVCRIDVTIDRRGARLEVDGQLHQEGKGEFWLFVDPGKHTLRVRLEGFEDEIKEIEASAGAELDVTFTMRRLSTPIADHPTPTPPLKQQIGKQGWFVLGIGAVVIFEATPTPAFGPHIFGAWRSRSWWEIGIELRSAWSLVEDERFPDTRFVSWSAAIAPCGRWRRRWFACGLVQLDGMTSLAHPKVALLPGFGLRGGVEFVPKEWLHVQLWGEGVAHPGSFEVKRKYSWDGLPVVGALGVRTLFPF